MGNRNKNKKVLISIAVISGLAVLMAGFLLPSLDSLAQEGGESEIKELSDEIKDKQSDIEELRDKIEAYQQSLEAERSKASSLKSQIYILETQIQKKEAEIALNEEEISKTNLEIKKTTEEIVLNEASIDDKQLKLARFLRELYVQDQKNDLEIIIMNESIADFFNQIQATETIQAELGDNLVELKELKAELEGNRADLEEKNKALSALQEKLLGSKGSLEDQQYTKQYILDETRSSEARYKNLVNELKLEQDRINAEIIALEKAIRDKLSGDQSKLSELGAVAFSWPVSSHVITASFHDPDYPFRHIFEHPAIDIRASQGTPLRAAASGYVAKARDGGRYGYSYIMLIHNDGFSTVYGHVNQIYVKPDQFVTQGEVIGATGGMPGTNGAGNLTTGPHLHFEIRKNGIPVNPLDYLP